MKELEVGDEVWVRCVVANVENGRVTAAYGPVTFRTLSVDLRPVEQSLTTATDPPITKEDVSVVDRYCELVRSQSDFAWTIFANLSVMAQDAGAPSKEANERAADLMRSWFSLNIRESEQWKQGTVYHQVVERPPTKEPTEAQKLAERTMKAMWAANDAVNERPPSVEPPECPQGFRHLEKGEKILASDVPVVPEVQQVWNQNEIRDVAPFLPSPGDRVRVADDGGNFTRRSGTVVAALPTYCEVVLDGNGHTHAIDTNRLEQMREAYPSDTYEADEEDPFYEKWETEIKVEGEDTPSTTTSKDYYGPDISKVTFQFTQTPNTLGTTDPSGVGSEDIAIDCEYQLPGEEPFFVIRSDSGWSFDDPESFLKLLLSVKEAEEKCRCSLPQS
jgi:hypothetical protein